VNVSPACASSIAARGVKHFIFASSSTCAASNRASVTEDLDLFPYRYNKTKMVAERVVKVIPT
jgi:nucleoside-diphosphate-sugar epimerase